jgi:putative hydrolase of the HAD superfamily
VYELLVGEIDRRHQASRSLGVEFPEVDIVEVWRTTLVALQARGWTEASPERVDLSALAVEHEMRANAVWPMPHLQETLDGLRRAGLTLGIVSNAQFYTPQIFPALLDRTLEDLGFAPDLLFFSYQHGRAKPGSELYRLAASALQKRGIPPDRVLYVGNDVRNDILPAAQVGFRTALFAGDARSLRRHADDPNIAGVVPDVVVTELLEVYTVVSD